MSLKFYYEKNQMFFQIDISGLSNLESLKIVVKNKFSLAIPTGNIGFIEQKKNNSDQGSKKFLDFEALSGFGEEQIINVVQSASVLVANLLKSISDHNVARISLNLASIRPYIEDRTMINKLYSNQTIPQFIKLVSADILEPRDKDFIWLMIEQVISNYEYSFEKSERDTIYDMYIKNMRNVNLAKVFKAVYEQNDGEEGGVGLPSEKAFNLIDLNDKDINAAIVHVSILNIVIANRYRLSEVIPGNLLKLKLYHQAIHIFDKFVTNEAYNSEKDRLVVLADTLNEAQNIAIKANFSDLSRMTKKRGSIGGKKLCDGILKYAEDIVKKNSMPTSLIYEFSDQGKLETYFATEGYGLLLGLCLMHIFEHRQDKFSLVQSFFTYNESSDNTKKHFPIVDCAVHSIDIMMNIIKNLSSDISIYNGIFKPIFFEDQPANEFFRLVMEMFFINWKEMNGSSDTLQNVFNFTEYQFQEIMKISACRKQTVFTAFKSYIPTYLSKIHTWLKLNVNSIIQEPILLPKVLLEPLQKDMAGRINSMICESRISYMQSKGVTMEKIHRGKDKQHIHFKLDQYYNFTYTENLNGKQGTGEVTLKPSEFLFVTVGDIPASFKSKIDEQILKKVNNQTIYIVFKKNIFVAKPLSGNRKLTNIIDDCLCHLSGNELKSEMYMDEFSRLLYISMKVQLFELDNSTLRNLKEPQMPSKPPTLIE
ncbi:MAG: hypothetical protein MHMPM18_002258 [Marteilia pararefringens]